MIAALDDRCCYSFVLEQVVFQAQGIPEIKRKKPSARMVKARSLAKLSEQQFPLEFKGSYWLVVSREVQARASKTSERWLIHHLFQSLGSGTGTTGWA
jgi:hypothetical protein